MEHKNRIRKNTYSAPEYELGRGATIDLVILFIKPCISCSESQKVKLQQVDHKISQKKKGQGQPLLTAAICIPVYPSKFPSMVDANKNCFEFIRNKENIVKEINHAVCCQVKYPKQCPIVGPLQLKLMQQTPPNVIFNSIFCISVVYNKDSFTG